MPPISPVLQGLALALDGVDIAMCVLDQHDCTLVWNRAFLRIFPEHAERIHVGEHYRDNLRRFYQVRLTGAEMDSIERYIDEGVARNRAQQRPFNFEHHGIYLQAASLPLPGVGRVRVWRQLPTPRLSDVKLSPLEQLSAGRIAPEVAEQRALFEHVGDGVMLTDADNRITWVNEHFVRLFGLAHKADAAGQSFESVYRGAWQAHPDADTAPLEAGLATLTENMRFAGAPFELPLPAGAWVRVIEQRRHDGAGFFALVDITALKRQQAELISAERRARASEALLAEKSGILETTLEGLAQGVIMVNAASRVQVCNRRAIDLLGLPAAMIASQPVWSQVVPYLGAALDAAVGLGQPAPRRVEVTCENGRVLELERMPMTGGGMLLTFTDVTDRHHAEARRQVLELQLREAHRLEVIGSMAGGIAHDFNNIMAAILGNVALARHALDAGGSAAPFLDQINVSGQRARSLVQQILAYSRRQSEAFTGVPLRPLVDEALGMLRALSGPAVHLQAHLSDEELTVRGNATQLQQVLMNLGTNALQSLPAGAGHIDIGLAPASLAAGTALPSDVSDLPPGEYVRIWVRDDGCGIEQAVLAQIFEPFFTTKPVGHGTGWGLAVARGVVQAHGGAIAVDTQPGQGSTFTVYLPRAVGLSPVAGQGAGNEPAAAAPGQGEHVMYIDDDEAMLPVVRALLERLGYRATCLLDPLEALARLRQDPQAVDLVLTDFNMPQITGLELARELAQIRPDLPVAISSGYIADETRARAAELGVLAVMQKERTLEELGGLVQELLRDR